MEKSRARELHDLSVETSGHKSLSTSKQDRQSKVANGTRISELYKITIDELPATLEYLSSVTESCRKANTRYTSR